MAKSSTAKSSTTKTSTPKKDVAKTAAKGAPQDPVKTSDQVKDVAPVKKGAVLTTTHIGDHLASTFDLPKSHARIYLNEVVALMGKHLKKGSRVRLAGLGVFQVKKRPARKGRNPNTGESIKIKASKRVVFAASRDLKAKL